MEWFLKAGQIFGYFCLYAVIAGALITFILKIKHMVKSGRLDKDWMPSENGLKEILKDD